MSIRRSYAVAAYGRGLMRDDLVDALAIARISKLIRNDAILDRPRVWMLLRTPAKVDELLQCPWCLGVWVAAGVVLARRTMPRLWGPLADVLAASYVAAHLAVYVEPKDPVPGQADD